MDVTNRLQTVVGIEGVQSYIGQIRAMQGAVNNLRSELESFGITGRAMVELTAGVAMLTAGFKLAGFAIREASKELKYLRVMTFAFNSREMAEAKMGEVTKLSTKYGLEKEVLGQMYSRLGAFGVAPNQLQRATVNMADLAASTGDRTAITTVMERLALIQEMGGISSRTMTMLARQGMPVHQIVAAQLAREQGGDEAGWLKKISKPGGGAIKGIDDPFEFMMRAIENSRWKGIALKEAQGFGGSMARIKIAWGNFWDSTGEQLIKVLTPLLRVIALVVGGFQSLNDATGGKAGLVIILALLVQGFRLTVSAVIRSWAAINSLIVSLNTLAASATRAATATGAAAAGNAAGAVGGAAGRAAGTAGAGAAVGAAMRVGIIQRISLWLSALPGAVQVAQLTRWLRTGGFLTKIGGFFRLTFWPLLIMTIVGWIGEAATSGLSTAKLMSSPMLAAIRGTAIAIGEVLNPFRWLGIVQSIVHKMGWKNAPGAAYIKEMQDRVYNRQAETAPGGKTEAEQHLANIDKNTAAMANITAWGNKDWRLDTFLGSRLRRAEKAQMANGRPG